METRYRARIENMIDGERKSMPVFPQSKNHTTFTDKAHAWKAIERRVTNATVRGLVYPVSVSVWPPENLSDWHVIDTMAF